MKYTASILNVLSCAYCRSADGGIDATALQNMRGQGSKSVCGMVFKKGDIVWTCRQCGKDPTCVQCDACFRNSDHKGHEVYFHRSGGSGGCCDCGDPEAWTDSGNCAAHGNKETSPEAAAAAAAVDPSDSLPSLLRKGVRAVMRGVVGVLSSFACAYSRGFHPWNENDFAHSSADSEKLLVYLHNDDKHSYQEVTEALMGCGVSSVEAAELTEKVDKDGRACAAQGSPAEVKKYHDILAARAGLYVTIVPAELDALSAKLHATFMWMVAVGQMHEGLRRVLVHGLLEDSEALPSGCGAVDVVADRVYTAAVQPVALFSNLKRFPMTIPFLDGLDRALGDSMEGSGATSASPPAVASGGAKSYPRPAELYRFQAPLLHARSFASNALGLLVLASPLLPKALQTDLSEGLVVTYQHDALFKSAYAQVLTLLYPCLHCLYVRGVGTDKESVFNTTVQIYTADSAVDVMSSAGVANRHFDEGVATEGGGAGPAHITSLLACTVLASLLDMRHTSPSTLAFLEHSGFRNRRLWKIFHCLEYVLGNPVAAALTLGGRRDPNAVPDWMRVCQAVQCLHMHKRETGAHVELETRHWEAACNLNLEIDRVSTKLIGRALLADPSVHAHKSLSAGRQLSTSLLTEVTSDAFSHCLLTLRSWFAGTEPDTVKRGACEESSVLSRFSVHYPALLRMAVSKGYVSVNIPLHRFAGRLVHFAACRGLDLAPLLSHCRDQPVAAVALMDYPLQCLCFAAQVHCDMWRRNGSPALNVVYNYVRAPLCCHLRDIDLVCVQTAAVALGGDVFLGLALRRFEVVFPFPQRNHPLLEYNGPLLAELLRLLVLTFTHVPTILLADQQEGEGEGDGDGRPSATPGATGEEDGLEMALRREIVHMIAGGASSFGALQGRVKHMVATENLVTDALVKRVVCNICVQRPVSGAEEGRSGEGQKISTELFPSQLDYFDPEHWHMSEKERQLAMDKVREHRRKEAAAAGVKVVGGQGADTGTAAAVLRRRRPVVYAAALPTPHSAFAPLRQDILFRPLFCALLVRAVDTCMDSPKLVGQSVKHIVGRVVHLVTLQLHCSAAAARDLQSSVSTSAISSSGAGTGTDASSFPALNALTGSQLFFSFAFDIIHRAQAQSAQASSASVAGSPPGSPLRGSSASASADPGSTGTAPGSPGPGAATSAPLPFTEEQLVCVKAYWDLFAALTRVWDSRLLQHDDLYWEGLEWIFQEISEKSGIAREYLASTRSSLSFASEQAIQEARRAEQREKRKKAQQRMTTRISALASQFVVPDDSSDNEEDGTGAADADSDLDDDSDALPTLDCHENMCIICQERRPQSSIGFLGFLQPSALARVAQDRSPDCPDLRRVYRVVALQGCTVYASPTDSPSPTPADSATQTQSHVLGHLAQNDHVLSDERVGSWCHIVAPMEGWCAAFRWHQTTNASGKPEKGRKVPLLRRVSDLQHGCFGDARLHASQCGHMMHFACYDAFFSGCLQKAYAEMADEVVDVRRRNLLCPMCKTVSNVLVPFTPVKIARRLMPRAALTEGKGKEQGQGNADDSSAPVFVPPVIGICSGRDGSDAFQLGISVPMRTRMAARLQHDCSDCSGKAFSLSIEAKAVTESCVERGFVPAAKAPWEKVDDFVASEKASIGAKAWAAKGLHALWAAASYTLFAATCADRACVSINDGSSSSSSSSSSSAAAAIGAVETEKSMELARSLLLVARQAPSWFNAQRASLFSACITDPLLNLLLPIGGVLNLVTPRCTTEGGGRDDSGDGKVEEEGKRAPAARVSASTPFRRTSADFRIIDVMFLSARHCSDILLTLPAPTVHSSGAWPGHLRIKSILGNVERVLAGAQSSSGEVAAPAPADSADDVGLPLLLKPLLAQDLTCVAAALVTVSSSEEDAWQLLQLLCAARLCQVLIEPMATGMVPLTPAFAQASAVSSIDAADTESVRNANGPLKRVRPNDGSGSDCASAEGNRLAQYFNELRAVLVARAGLGRAGGSDGAASSSIALANMPSGVALLALVTDSWVPFVQYVAVLMQTVRSMRNSSAASGAAPAPALAIAASAMSLDGSCAALLQLLDSVGLGTEGFRMIATGEEGVGAGDFRSRVLLCAAVWGDAYGQMYSPGPKHPNPASPGHVGDLNPAAVSVASADGDTLVEILCSRHHPAAERYMPGDYIPKPRPVRTRAEAEAEAAVAAAAVHAMDLVDASSPDATSVAGGGAATTLQHRRIADGEGHEGDDYEEEEEEEFDADLWEEAGGEGWDEMHEEWDGEEEDGDAGGGTYVSAGDYQIDIAAGTGGISLPDLTPTVGKSTVAEVEAGDLLAFGLIEAGAAVEAGVEMDADTAGEVGEISGAGMGAYRRQLVDQVLSEASRQSAAAAAGSTSSAATGVGGEVEVAVDVTGADPILRLVDEYVGSMFDVRAVKLQGNGERGLLGHAITCVHSHTPFQGSVSGTAVVRGLHGESLDCGFADLSHMGLGVRHGLRLVKLPNLFTTVYHQVRMDKSAKV